MLLLKTYHQILRINFNCEISLTAAPGRVRHLHDKVKNAGGGRKEQTSGQRRRIGWHRPRIGRRLGACRLECGAVGLVYDSIRQRPTFRNLQKYLVFQVTQTGCVRVKNWVIGGAVERTPGKAARMIDIRGEEEAARVAKIGANPIEY